MRSEPIIVNRIDPFARGGVADQAAFPSFLILNQADGLDRMKLRVFALPIDRPDAPSLLQPEPRIRGWSWFPPYVDGEKLAFITDLGVFGLYGINQVRNEDAALFPEFREECRLVETAASLGRAQVVHAVENDFWVVANGDLQRVHFDIYRQKESQKVSPVWPKALRLGSPLHAAQSDETGKTLFLVTQDPERQIHRATAVEADSGKILWQRQLGLEIQGEPLRLGNQVFCVDHGGGLFQFDPARDAGRPGREWQVAESIAARPLPGGAMLSYLLPGTDGATVYQVSCPEQGKELTVRKYLRGGGATASLEERKMPLPAPLVSAPALGAQSLLLLTADGVVQRLSLPIDGRQQQPGGRSDEN